MTPQPDDGGLDLSAPLERLFAAVATRLQEVQREGQQPTEHDQVLEMVNSYISAPLMDEAEAAGPTSPATWHLAHLALAVVAQAGVPEGGQGSGRYRRVNAARRDVAGVLTEVRHRHEWTVAAELEEIEHRVDRLPDKVEDALLKTLPYAVARAVLAIIQPPPTTPVPTTPVPTTPVPTTPVPTTPVPTTPPPTTFADLDALAQASASDYTISSSLRIAFLTGALAALKRAGTVPTNLLAPITTAVMGVIDFINPNISFADLLAITSLKQSIVPYLNV